MKKKFNFIVFMVLMFMITFITPVWGAEGDCEQIASATYKCENRMQYLCLGNKWAFERNCTADETCMDIEATEIFAGSMCSKRTSGECSPGDSKCEGGKQYQCEENGWWNSGEECETKMCIPDNSRCAYSDEVQTIIDGTFYNPLCEQEEGKKEAFKCENGKQFICRNNRWVYQKDCKENESCYSFKSEEIYTGSICYLDTYTPPENDDGSPFGSGYQYSRDESNFIPDYPVGVDFNFKNATVGGIVTKLLDYVFVIAGLILLVMLVMGGLGLMTAAGNPDKMKEGYGKITNALIGFLIIVISYFVVQLVETILRIKIL